MSSTPRKARLTCSLSMLLILLLVSQVSAQETGTLIVYTESQGGDAAFTYTGAPNSTSTFQIATEEGGGARVFDLPIGTYGITQTTLPANWTLQEVFCEGTGNYSVNQTQGKATVTIGSFTDVVYLRFTNENASVIPEFPHLPAILLFVAVASLSALALAGKHKKKVAPAFALLFSACILMAWVGTAAANPDKTVQLGTRDSDEQYEFGTPNSDVIVQLGFGGNDTQYGEGSEGDDIIVQNGGGGNDYLMELGGDGKDYLAQEGGEGDDDLVLFAEGSNCSAVQNGGDGDDRIYVLCGTGVARIVVSGGEGADNITADGSTKFDWVRIDAGLGDDKINYTVTRGADLVFIDGGVGNDSLTIQQFGYSFQLLDGSGSVFFSFGGGSSTPIIVNLVGGFMIIGGDYSSSGSSTITVASVEHGRVLDDDRITTIFQW